jgi:hypothetical protein
MMAVWKLKSDPSEKSDLDAGTRMNEQRRGQKLA